jgi:hypothetical protein
MSPVQTTGLEDISSCFVTMFDLKTNNNIPRRDSHAACCIHTTIARTTELLQHIWSKTRASTYRPHKQLDHQRGDKSHSLITDVALSIAQGRKLLDSPYTTPNISLFAVHLNHLRPDACLNVSKRKSYQMIKTLDCIVTSM